MRDLAVARTVSCGGGKALSLQLARNHARVGERRGAFGTLVGQAWNVLRWEFPKIGTLI